jgi:hypothetical protein
MTPHLVTALPLLAALVGGDPPEKAPEEIRVTVVAILASTDRNAKVAPELVEIAREVQKKDPTLKGFRMWTTNCKGVPVGGEYSFDLVDNEVAVVIVQKATGKDDKPCIKVKPPHVDPITCSLCCGKYLPIMTNYQTKKKERLIIAIMVETCREK